MAKKQLNVNVIQAAVNKVILNGIKNFHDC